jgi:hypothetical protein
VGVWAYACGSVCGVVCAVCVWRLPVGQQYAPRKDELVHTARTHSGSVGRAWQRQALATTQTHAYTHLALEVLLPDPFRPRSEAVEVAVLSSDPKRPPLEDGVRMPSPSSSSCSSSSSSSSSNPLAF